MNVGAMGWMRGLMDECRGHGAPGNDWTNKKLIFSRLKEFLRQRLVECGWREELKAYAKDYIQSKGLEQVSVEQLIQDMTPKGRGESSFVFAVNCSYEQQRLMDPQQKALVPESVKGELFVRVRRFLNEDPS
jgi:hypothetical protein